MPSFIYSSCVFCRQLNTIPGEFIIETFDSVEDTKGNNGERGILKVTNLRLIWYAVASNRINLCTYGFYYNILGLYFFYLLNEYQDCAVLNVLKSEKCSKCLI